MINARDTYRKVSKTINDFSHDNIEGLTSIIKSFRGENVDFKANGWLKKNFPNQKYEDVNGLCKIVAMKDIIDCEYALSPTRYVGFQIIIDENFDYKERLNQIKKEFSKLNEENLHLKKEIEKM